MWSEVTLEIVKFFTSLFQLPSRQIKKVISIYDSMHRVLDETSVERFLVFKAHNGGGHIKPNTPLYVSALYEDYTHPFHSVKDKYQRLECDKEYVKMLVDVCEIKKVEKYTHELPDNSLLRSIYELEGVKYSEIFFLGQDRRNLYFCSCATSRIDAWQEKEDQKTIISLEINNIRNNIR